MSDTSKTIEVIKPCPECDADGFPASESGMVACGIVFKVDGHEGAEVITLTEQIHERKDYGSHRAEKVPYRRWVSEPEKVEDA